MSNIDKKVVSLELSKKLWEAGITKDMECAFYWIHDISYDKLVMKLVHIDPIGNESSELEVEEVDQKTHSLGKIPSPLAVELMERLPHGVNIIKDYETMTPDPASPQVFYYHVSYHLAKEPIIVNYDNLPNALAKMILYLHKEGML